MLRRPLIHRHKTAARIALFAVPVLLAAAGWAVVELLPDDIDAGQHWFRQNFEESEEITLLREYLRIDTSYPDGNEIPGAEFLARQLEAAGIAAHVERLGERNANLWAIFEGEDPQAIVLHNHIDVDPILRPDLWKHPPFGGVLEGPWIYGRGAFDMKSYAIAQLLALRAVAESGHKPERSLIFLATGEEERESRLGSRRILRQHPELVARFAAVITEGGAVEATSIEGGKYWGTEFAQKRFVDVWVCDARRERLEGLREDILALGQRGARPHLTTPVAEFLDLYGGTRSLSFYREILETPERLVSTVDFYALPRNVKAMLRNEVVPFPVEEDPSGGYRMRVILHLLPGAELEEAWEELLPGGMLSVFTQVVDVPHGVVRESSTGHPVYQTIHRMMRRAHPEIPHGPLFVPWAATDARFFRAAGIPAYGFTPFLILSTDTQKMKGPNERIAAPAFVDGVELYAELVRELVD